MRMPRRLEALAAAALVATLLGMPGAVHGADDAFGRGAPRAWQSVFGDRPEAAPDPRVLVVLVAPSLADRMRASGETPSPEQQRRFTAEAEGAQRLLIAGLAKRGIRIERDHFFTRTFNGFSARVGPRALAELERAPGVAGIYPVRSVYAAAGSPAAPIRSDRGGATAGGVGVSLPGVDGDGVVVGLLDSGVDRSHPYFGGRVLRGYDIVDGDRDVAPEAKPDERATLDAHGTRSAGLVVGRGGPDGSAGVALGARVLPIRVLGWSRAADGSYALLGRGDELLAGFERAVDPDADGDVEDVVDILLAPVVEPYAAFADSPEARAVAGASALGALVVAPAGTDGRPGPGFGNVGAPGGAADALSVGALDARRLVPEAGIEMRSRSATLLDETVRVLGFDGPDRRLRLAAVALLGPTLAAPEREAGAEASGSELGDFFDARGVSLVAGRAVLVPADGSSLPRKVRNAAAAGAAAVLVYGTELPAGALGRDEAASLPVLAVPAGAGREALEALRDGEAVEVTLGAGTSVSNPSLLDVAGFSSGGLAFDGGVKPDVVAPGVGLVTAEPAGRYGTATGTSAAAATVAGAAALLAQARPDLSALELKSLLVGSAVQLARGERPLPVTAQGAGLLDPARAAAAELAVAPATLAFGRADGPGWSAARTITVKNVSTRALEVGFSIALDEPGEPAFDFSADPTRAALRPGASVAVSIGISARGNPPVGAGGALVVGADGAPLARVPWAVAGRTADRTSLVGEVQLSHAEFSPSKAAPAVLAFRAGRIERTPDGEAIEPVGMLEVELWAKGGRRLGVLARLRDVLPGRYAFGLTGRGPQGGILAEGAYVLRLRAYPVDGDDGTRPSTAEAVFRITH